MRTRGNLDGSHRLGWGELDIEAEYVVGGGSAGHELVHARVCFISGGSDNECKVLECEGGVFGG